MELLNIPVVITVSRYIFIRSGKNRTGTCLPHISGVRPMFLALHSTIGAQRNLLNPLGTCSHLCFSFKIWESVFAVSASSAWMHPRRRPCTPRASRTALGGQDGRSGLPRAGSRTITTSRGGTRCTAIMRGGMMSLNLSRPRQQVHLQQQPAAAATRFCNEAR